MKKIILILIILLQMVVYSQFSGGTGTLLDPYQVATAEDLDNIRNYLEDSFIQTADIDLGVAPWNVGEGWVPIGDYDWTNPSKSFRGNYNGDGYEITNMYINRPSETYLGLFASSDGVFFQNMSVINFNIMGGSPVGGIVGISYNDSISNCIAIGKIEGHDTIGLLVGFFEGYTIKDCHVQGEITSRGGWTGGLIGTCNADSIKNCSSDVTITNDGYFVGGLLGFCTGTGIDYVTNCYSICNLLSTGNNTGGLIGAVSTCDNLTINSCFTKGIVTSSNDKVGGIIGGHYIVNGVKVCKS